MLRETRVKCLAALIIFWSSVCFLYSVDALGGETSQMPEMPVHWQVVSDFQVPPDQVEAMGSKFGAELSSVRNTVYDVNGKRVQINVIVTPDPANLEKLMMKLGSIKTEEALLQKGLTVYEFVGQNDVLPLITEGRKHLGSM